MGLSNYELVLLDNLICLEKVSLYFNDKNNTQTIGAMVDTFLDGDGYIKNGLGFMDTDEWREVLNAIKCNEKLCNLEIHDVTENEASGFFAAILVGADENVILFRDTSSPNEWIDNGQGGYSVSTAIQEEALKYVNNIDLVNNNSFVASGHSKGGNLAQYVTLFATETLIDRCLSFDGQGFSEELCSTPEYEAALKRNGDKLYTIASENDVVNVLFNSAVPEEHKMYIAANPESNPLYCHKGNNILSSGIVKDENGKYIKVSDKLNATVPISPLTFLLRDFVQYIIKDTSIDNKQVIFDSLMLIAAAEEWDDDDLELAVKGDTGRLVLDILADYVLPILALSNSEWIIPCLYVKGIDAVVDSGDKLMSLLGCESNQGVLSQILEKGVLECVIASLVGYGLNNPDKIAFCILEFDEKNGLPENIRTNLFNMVGDIYRDIENTRAFWSHLGENTAGSIYRAVTDEGINVIRGTGKTDYISGTTGSDYLHGGNGEDMVGGGAGDDTIFGGRGDDDLIGGTGSDIYVIEKYDGIDKIYDFSAENDINSIRFGSGIVNGRMEYERGTGDSADSLIIHYNPDHYEDCYVEIINFFSTEKDGKLQPPIDMLLFENGGVVYADEILGKVG